MIQPAPALAQGSYTVFQGGTSQAGPQPVQPTPHATESITLDVHNSTVGFVLQAIAKQARRQILYDNSNPRFAERINVKIHEAKIMDAIATTLRGTGLIATLASDGETIVIRPPSHQTNEPQQQGGVINGRIVDSASNRGISGATVTVEGTKLRTITSDSGSFTLQDVPSGDQVLVIKAFGYKPLYRPVTVRAEGRVTVRIIMGSTATILSGVVTTATGVQRKITVGNDITTLNVDSIQQVAPITSVTDLLETRVPGLTVIHSSGSPGDPSRIRIRGASSITGNNDPIVIVDGVRVYAAQSDARNNSLAPSENLNYSVKVPGSYSSSESVNSYTAQSPLDQIDPNSIATIEVLKGPSASAMYGSDAANGVIVITTKHGHVGPTQWSATLGAGVNWLPGTWPTNYYRFGYDDYSNTGPLCSWDNPGCHIDSIVAFQALNDPNYTLFTHGHDQNASLTVSGGENTLRYSVTGAATQGIGNLKLPAVEAERYASYYGSVPGWMLHPDRYTTWGVTGSLTANPSSTVQVTIQSSLFNSNKQTGSLRQAISQLSGEYLDSTVLGTSPLIQNDVERARTSDVTATNAMSLAWSPRPWLPLLFTGGLNTIQSTDVNQIPYGVNSCAIPDLTSECFGADTTGFYGLGRGTSQNRTLNVGTTVPLGVLALGVGGNWTSQTTSDVQASTNQLAPGISVPTTFPTTVTNGVVPSSFSQTSTAQASYGWYVEPRFSFNSRLYVSPGFRLDGGSATGANAGLTGFPKVDVSYVAIDQDNARGILSSLRLRTAFGYAGTQPGPAQRLRLISTVNTGQSGVVSLDGTNTVYAATVSTLGNSQLRPERTRELEGGFDAEFWNGRLAVTYTGYNDTRSDAIISIPVAPSVHGSGNNIYKNIGVVRNTGTELSLNVQLLDTRAMSWYVNGDFSHKTSKVVRLNPGQSTITVGYTRVEAGYPLFGLWAYPIASYSDQNQDGIIESGEIRLADSAAYMGSPDPINQMDFNTGGTLFDGRLSVAATFSYQNGLTQYNQGALTSGAITLLANNPNTSLATQAAIVATGIGQYSTPIGLIQTVNVLRFNSLSISYHVPRNVASMFHAPRMSLALQGSNLGLHTNYRGKDPNVTIFSTSSGSGDQTVDAGQIPEPRTWWLKVILGN